MKIAIHVAIFIKFFYFSSGRSISDKGKCSTVLSNGDKEWHCCDNHEEINGTCVGCTEGYRSDNGENCHPCPKGLYGRKCGERCLCEEFQECNIMEGCRNNSDVGTVATRLYDLSTHQLFTRSSTIQDTNEEDFVGNSTTLIICTCTISFCVIICMIWFRHHTKQRLASETGNSRKKSNEIVELSSLLAGGIYDYIDESNICDLVKPPQIDKKEKTEEEEDNFVQRVSDEDDTDNNSGTENSLDDGYLNPYNKLGPPEENRGYDRIGDVYDRTSANEGECNKTDMQILLLVNNDKLIENDQMETSKYITMHEPVGCSLDEHCSVSMQEMVPD